MQGGAKVSLVRATPTSDVNLAEVNVAVDSLHRTHRGARIKACTPSGGGRGTVRELLRETAHITQTYWLKLLSWALVAPLVACAGENISTPHVPAALSIVSGNDQVDSIGAILAESLVVRVTTSSGTGLGMVPVAWQPDGGFVYPETTATDPSGVARSRWTLGLSPGPARVVVFVPDGALTDTFTATVRAGRAVRILLVRQGPAWIIPSDSLGILASVNDRLGNPVPSTAIQWSSSDPLVATVSDAGPGHPPVAPGQVQVVIHAVAAGRANVVGHSGDATGSVGVTVVRDTAVYGGYDLERRDTVAYPYCQYPVPYEVDCFSGSLTLRWRWRIRREDVLYRHIDSAQPNLDRQRCHDGHIPGPIDLRAVAGRIRRA